MTQLFGFFFMLALLFQRRGAGGGGGPFVPPGGDGGGGLPPPMPPPIPGSTDAPAPWPQAVPSDLPPFPGAGWEYDDPPPPDVVARAWQLVNPLWAQGAGAYKTEQTGGRWITYRAEIVAGGAKGVTAWRVRVGASSSPAPSASSAPRVSVPPFPTATLPPPIPPMPQIPPPGAPQGSPAAVPAAYRTTAPTGSFQPFYVPPAGGMTTTQIQIALNNAGAAPTLAVDGQYGNLTRAAVVGFQRDHGLLQDGKAGPATQEKLRPYLAGAPSTSPAAVPAAARATAPGPFVPVYQPPAGGMTVAQIQAALNAAGALPPLASDGKYGPATAAAVTAFQRSHGLAADGKAGPQTQSKLAPFLSGGAPPAASSPSVFASALPPVASDAPPLSSAQIQTALNVAGAMPPLKVDGKLGPASKAAIVAFQRKQGLSADGIAGPMTQAKLRPYLAGLV